MTKRQVLNALQHQIDEAGSLRAWCRTAEYQRWNAKTKAFEPAGFSASYVSDVLNGNVAPSKNLLRYLGLEAVKEVRYRRIEAEAA
jgi:hypothetical protein